MDKLFIGGSLAVRSVHTLQHLGITHIICLCLDEIGQSNYQHPELFEYKDFSISVSVMDPSSEAEFGVSHCSDSPRGEALGVFL
ncbi:Dual specificity protein phosphatase PHS1 [Platanthera guangdongensis]|uniref:Dual specificity protein phosphatase PHS1 n=1 Tax=Platanthera guangdongensis TaxID=2320717 RepID=A0ABR2LW92_9ASPA